MNTFKKIHCPVCKGIGKVNNQYGLVACLNCEGTGIVELTNENQSLKDIREIQEKSNIVKNPENVELKNTSVKEESSPLIGCTIAVVIIIGIVTLIYFNWDSVLEFLKNILAAIFAIIVGIVIIGALFSAGNSN
jgi:hypothetical protein